MLICIRSAGWFSERSGAWRGKLNQPQQVATGGCSCSAIRYAVKGEPDEVLVCHCPDCRRAVGAHAVAYFFIPITKFEITKGKPAEYASSKGVIRKFCSNCGTTLSWEGDKQPGRIDVTIGSLDDPEQFVPTRAVYRKHRLSWASEI